MEHVLNISKRIIPAILLIILLFVILWKPEVKANESYRYTYNGSNIDTNKYPGIKEKIDVIKRNHPNWTFTIMETGIDWNQAIKAEYSGHGGIPLNLIHNKSGAWICSICGDKIYDSGSWKCSSEMTIAYYMDPRNWLVDNEYLFQFLQIDYINSTDEAIYNALSNTFLHNWDYAREINEACRESNVNPYFILARILQEQGTDGRGSWKMQDGGTTYYNLFNIGATGNSPAEILANSLNTAKSRGWTSVKASIKGGVNTLTDYINRKQNTQYLNKFDVEPYAGTYLWQYMQNIEAPKAEASSMYSKMKNANLLNQSLNFIIPVYTNMPATTSPSPDGVGEITPKNIRVKEGHTDVILRSQPNTTSSIVYTIPNSSVVLLSVERLSGGWHKVVLTDGRFGYVKFDYSYLEEIDDVVNCYETKVINSDNVAFNVGPGTSQTKLTTLSYGQTVTRIDNTGRYTFGGTTWDRVILADGRQGFVERKYLKDLDATETFTIQADGGLFLKSQPSTNEQYRIRLLANGGKVTRIGTYTVNGVETKVGDYYWDYVVTADGSKGYVARSYLRDVNGKVPGPYGKIEVKKDDSAKTIRVTPATSIDDIKAKLGNDMYITRANGDCLDSNVSKTGDKFYIGNNVYTLVKKGDCNGDGDVDIIDMALIKRDILNTKKLNGVYKRAGIIENETKTEIDIIDMALIRRQLLGTELISLK